MTPDLAYILQAYEIAAPTALAPVGSGLIHKTWKIVTAHGTFILQQVNHNIFREPGKISENLHLLEAHIRVTSPHYLFVPPLPTRNGDRLIHHNDAYYRLFRYVENSHTVDVVTAPEQAYEAAYQFSKFSRVFSNFDSHRLHITLPRFHDLLFREQQLSDALIHGSPERLIQARDLIKRAEEHAGITEVFRKIQDNSLIKVRVTHHDTKISNVLFDPSGKGITVIDLDTVMPGYYISDLGDMMRTYLSSASEEVADFTAIEVREDFFEAIITGFFENMRDVLTAPERDLIYYSGLFLIYMQAIRFLTDFLNNDVYYGAKYPEQNFVRAGNQFTLLSKYLEKKKQFESIIAKYL